MWLKQQCKRILFGGPTLAQWVAVGLDGDPDHVALSLTGLGEARDVTRNCVVAALRPLTFGIGLEADSPELQRSRPILQFWQAQAEGKRCLGEIRLRPVDALPLGARRLALFECGGYRNCYFAPLQVWSRYRMQSYRLWQQRKKRDPFNFEMDRRQLECLFLFYTRPRPVVLVTVVHGESSNIFPMDLIGPTETGYFTLALRSTSPAVELMKSSRRIALSGVPAEQVAVAYELGKHHKKQSIDWSTLPMEITQSPSLRLPVPRFALDVREMCIEHVHAVGSHTLFAARPIAEQNGAHAPRLFHVPGYFVDYCARAERPLLKAGA